jgi:hypothetical protein
MCICWFYYISLNITLMHVYGTSLFWLFKLKKMLCRLVDDMWTQAAC